MSWVETASERDERRGEELQRWDRPAMRAGGELAERKSVYERTQAFRFRPRDRRRACGRTPHRLAAK